MFIFWIVLLKLTKEEENMKEERVLFSAWLEHYVGKWNDPEAWKWVCYSMTLADCIADCKSTASQS